MLFRFWDFTYIDFRECDGFIEYVIDFSKDGLQYVKLLWPI